MPQPRPWRHGPAIHTRTCYGSPNLPHTPPRNLIGGFRLIPRSSRQILPPTAAVLAPDDLLEQLAQEGAQKLLQQALAEKVDSYLGRHRYERGARTGYRDGSCRSGPWERVQRR